LACRGDENHDLPIADLHAMSIILRSQDRVDPNKLRARRGINPLRDQLRRPKRTSSAVIAARN
jgi:hypothetical protein